MAASPAIKPLSAQSLATFSCARLSIVKTAFGVTGPPGAIAPGVAGRSFAIDQFRRCRTSVAEFATLRVPKRLQAVRATVRLQNTAFGLPGPVQVRVDQVAALPQV